MTAGTAVRTCWLLQLPWTSPPLTLNQRLHWRPKAALTQQVRYSTYLLAKQAQLPSCQRIRVTLI